MVLTKVKIIVKGPAGSGKTTILNIIKEALSYYDNIQYKRIKEHGLIVTTERGPFPKEEKKDGNQKD